MKIPFSPPDITEAEVQEVASALRSGWITTGPRTKEFERQIAALCNTNKAVCLNSSTVCMEMALRLMEIGPGDEVIVPSYTYTATASVVCHVGAYPVMLDCAPGSWEMDYSKIADAINERTKAIIAVDLAGIVADYDKIFQAVESRRNIFQPKGEMQSMLQRVMVLADGAHALGASRQGRMAGEWADFTSFSFHAVKNLTTAEGGALVWNKNISSLGVDEKLYKQLQLFSLHGQSKDALAKTQLGAWEYDIIAPLYKCNMTDIMAAVGLAQMKRYPALLARRREIIERYNTLLADTPIEHLCHYSDSHASSGHLYITRIKGFNSEQRNAVITRMAEEGITTNVHYKPLPMMTAYRALGYDIKDFPNAYERFEGCITLPLYTLLTNEQVDLVAESFKRIIGC